MLKPEDFERIVEEYHLLYDCEDDYDTINQNFKPDEKEIDKEDYIFYAHHRASRPLYL